MLSSLRSPSSFRKNKSSQKQSKDSESNRESGQHASGADGLVHIAMSFKGSDTHTPMRSEWVLINPGAKEEKFQPWISFAEGAGQKRELLNSYNMQRLPTENYPLKEGFFIKSNQAQSSWKRRYFMVRAGLLVFFKDDPSLQPPGVAVLPQGAIPLQGCDVAMPMDFRRSFAWKARKGVSGYELKLGHSSRRPFLLVFPTHALRVEWCSYLSHYILHSFLSEEYKTAAKLHEVEVAPLYCWQRCGEEGTKRKKYLHLDWSSPQSQQWCLRVADLKLASDPSGGFDSLSTESLSACLPLRRITRVLVQLEGEEEGERSDGEQREPILLVFENKLGVSSSPITRTATVCHQFSPVSGSVEVVRQWHDAIRAAQQLQDQNSSSSDVPPSSSSPPQSPPSSIARGLTRSSSSKSVRELQDKLKQDRAAAAAGTSFGGEGGSSSSSNSYYSRADFMADSAALQETQQQLETLSNAAESGSEFEGNIESGGVRGGQESSSGVELEANDVTFVSTPQRRRHQNSWGEGVSLPTNLYTPPALSQEKEQGCNDDYTKAPTSSNDNVTNSNGNSNTLTPRMWMRQFKEYEDEKQGGERLRSGRPESVHCTVGEEDEETVASSQAARDREIEALTRANFLGGTRSTPIPASAATFKAGGSGSGEEDSGGASSSSWRGRVLVTKKGREQQGGGERDSASQSQSLSDAKDGGEGKRLRHRSVSPFSLNNLSLRSKRRLSTVIANGAEKNQEKKQEMSQNQGNGAETAEFSSPSPSSSLRGKGKVKGKGKASFVTESASSIVVEYPCGGTSYRQCFHIILTPRVMRVTKVVLSIAEEGGSCRSGDSNRDTANKSEGEGVKIAYKLSSKSIALGDVVSAEVDLNGTGLIRLWLSLPPLRGERGRGEKEGNLLVGWTVRAVSGGDVALLWLQRLKFLKSNNRENTADDDDIRNLL